MSIQHERISELCRQLNRVETINHYSVQAQTAASNKDSYSDLLESILSQEYQTKQSRSRNLLSKMADFPMIKTLDNFDFKFVTSVPKAKVKELSN